MQLQLKSLTVAVGKETHQEHTAQVQGSMLTCLSTSKTRRPGTSTRKVSWLLVLAMRDWLFTQAAESALSTACLST